MEKVFESYREETDGLLRDALRTARAALVWSWELLRSKAELEVRSEEGAPPVAPTSLGSLKGKGVPRTMQELGVPGGLAAEMEMVLGMMGKVRDGRIVGYSFRTPDGVAHALRTEPSTESRRNVNRAA